MRRAGFFVTAVRQGRYHRFNGKWLAVLMVGLAAYRGLHPHAHTSGLALAHHLRVAHCLQQMPHAEPPRSVKDEGRVAWAAAANVIAHVEQHHRADRCRLGSQQSLVDRRTALVERSAHLPGRQGHLMRHVIRQRLVVVGYGEKRHAHLGHVRIRVTLDHMDQQHTGALALGLRQPQQVRHRCIAGALAQDIDEQRRRHQRAGRPDLATHRLQQQARALHRLRVRINVRVGLVDRGDGGVVHHLLRQIAVHVQRHTNRHIRPHSFAHPAHQFAVGIRPGFGHCSAV